MKTKLLFTICGICAAMIFASCGLDKYADAAKSTAEIFGAESYSVELAKSAGSGSGTVLQLNLQNPKRIPNDYPDFYVTSVSALMFYRNIPVEAIKGVDQVEIELTKGNSRFSESYSLEELKTAELLTGRVAEYLDWKPESGLENMRAVIDSSFIQDSTLLAFNQNLQEMDAQFGPTLRHTIIGFKNSETTSHEPVLIVYAQAIKESGQIPFIFYLKKESGKIIYISTQEE